MPDIADFKGNHVGREVLLLGNGPSLRSTGNIAPGVLLMGMNQSWRVFPRPDYHVVLDITQESQPGGRAALRELGDRLFTICPFDYGISINLLTDLPQRSVTFSRDLTHGVVVDAHGVGSVMYMALQLAEWMGFARIWITGFEMGGPKFTGQPTGIIHRQQELFRLTPEDVRAKVRVIAPTACTVFEVAEWPW